MLYYTCKIVVLLMYLINDDFRPSWCHLRVILNSSVTPKYLAVFIMIMRRKNANLGILRHKHIKLYTLFLLSNAMN